MSLFQVVKRSPGAGFAWIVPGLLGYVQVPYQRGKSLSQLPETRRPCANDQRPCVANELDRLGWMSTDNFAACGCGSFAGLSLIGPQQCPKGVVDVNVRLPFAYLPVQMSVGSC